MKIVRTMQVSDDSTTRQRLLDAVGPNLTNLVRLIPSELDMNNEHEVERVIKVLDTLVRDAASILGHAQKLHGQVTSCKKEG